MSLVGNFWIPLVIYLGKFHEIPQVSCLHQQRSEQFYLEKLHLGMVSYGNR